MAKFTSFDHPIAAAVFGASGGIGRAFVDHLSKDEGVARVHAFARGSIDIDAEKVHSHRYDPHTDEGIAQAIAELKDEQIDLAIVTIGTLHDEHAGPEKAARDLEMNRFLEVMRINAGLPAMIGKHLLPLMKDRRRAILAALSARVGSISDNKIGGWHSYRASKAALNQLYRTLSIELQRRNAEGIAVTLHPGTVDTALSEPFQRNVPEGKLFTSEYAAGEMLKVLDSLKPDQSGRCFDYAGEEVIP